MKKLFLVLGMFLASAMGLFLSNIKSLDQQKEISYYALERQAREEGRKVPRKQRRPNDWYYVQRAYPNTTVPEGKQLKAIQHAQAMRNSAEAVKNENSQPWAQAGPSNIPGRITDLAVHPSYPNVIYAASASGGIFRQTSTYGTWEPIFDDVGVQSMGAIAIHPTNPNILYAGTGEANNAGSHYEGTGIYKTTDAGASWVHMGLPNSYHIARIVFDYTRPETLFVAVMGKMFGTNPERGVYRTTDGGNTWEQSLFVSDSTGCTDIAIEGSPSAGIIACMFERVRRPEGHRLGGITSGVYLSSDMGDSWRLLSEADGLPPPSPSTGRIGVSLHPWYGYGLLLYSDTAGNYTGIYQAISADGYWINYDPDNDLADLNGPWGGGWYFGNVRINPDTDFWDHSYALGLELYKQEEQYGPWFKWHSPMHVDMHALWIDSNDGNHLIAGNDGGVWWSTDGGEYWTLADDMTNTQFYSVTIDPIISHVIYGGTQDNGVLRNMFMDIHLWEEIHGGDGFVTVVDYTNQNIVYTEFQYGYLEKSIDHAETWTPVMDGMDYDNERHNWKTPVVMDPVNHMILYYGSNKMYRTTDGATLWTAISNDLTNGPYADNPEFGTITTIAVSRTNTNIIYAGTDDGNVQVSTNYGADWNLRNAGLPNRWVTQITCDPHDENVAYVTLSGYKSGSSDAHIYRTTDYGITWASLKTDLPDAPISDVVVNFHDNQILYIATDVGVYKSNDQGMSWNIFADGMPIVPVLDLDYHVRTRELIAGTHGRSAFRTITDCPDLNDDDVDGTPETCDNCPGLNNIGQEDADYDFIGDDCDECTDMDGDGYGDPGHPTNTCALDNCPDIYNPDQIDSDGDGVGDACAYRAEEWDTVSTACLKLIVGSNGNFGKEGFGGYNMDYSQSGDCDPNATIYLYDGSPILSYFDGADQVSHNSMYGNESFNLVTDQEFPVPTLTTADYDIYESGTFVTPDAFLAMEKTWWAPKNPDSCEFIIQLLRVYSYDGQAHSGIAISEAIDWDIPSDHYPQPINNGSYDAPERLLYIQGVEFDGTGCQPNDARFGGQAMMAYYVNDPSTIDTSSWPHSAYVFDNETYIFPYGGWDPIVTDDMIDNPAFDILGSNSDMNSIMTYFYDYTIGATDTLHIYSILTTVQNGSPPFSGDKGRSGLLDNIHKAKAWAVTHDVFSGPSSGNVCGDANGDGQVNVGDAVFLINFVFKGGPAPDPECIGDANGDGSVNVGDAVYLIAYVFKGGPPPVEDCSQ